MSPHRKGSFTNSDGQEIALRGISPWLIDGLASSLEKEWVAVGKARPAPPIYTVETVGGGTETRPHDKTTIETAEDKAAWAAYQKTQAEWDHAQQERLLRVVCMEGVITRPPDDGWITRQKFMGMDVPEDPLEREVYWVKTSLMHSTDDVQGIISEVMRLSGVSEEAIRNAENSFRDKVEESDGDAA